jgi:eukaryotic-like serine/threonine-protein kinase
MIRFLRLLAKILVLIIVALASALISMRLAIHGREVAVPDLRGMTPAQAERSAGEHGLELSLGDRFYSATVAAGRIVSQQPEPGTRVRRGWHVQAAESLGPQLIQIPSLIGMSPRAAEIDIRRRGLEPGDAAELPIDGFPSQSVLAQTPAPGAQGVAAPRVSLLYAVPPPEIAYAVPDLTGLTFAEASAIVNGAAGLHAVAVSPASAPAGNNALSNPQSAMVVGQTPAAGSRITPGSAITLQLAANSF